eukprot:g458.t1
MFTTMLHTTSACRLLFTVVLFLCFVTTCTTSIPPKVLESNVHFRDIAILRDHPGDVSAVVTDHYRIAVFTVAFDQPLYAATIDLDRYRRGHKTPYREEESFFTLLSRHRDPPKLFGSVRLLCGDKIVESHPEPYAPNAPGSLKKPIPSFVLPLHEPYDHPLFDMLRSAEHEAVVSGNKFLVAVVISAVVDYGDARGRIDEGGRRRRRQESIEFTDRRGSPLLESDVELCHLRFLKPNEWSHNRVSAVVTNFVGAAVSEHVDTFQLAPPPLASPALLEAAAGRVRRRHEWHDVQRRRGQATHSDHAHKKKSELMENARQYFKDKVSFDITNTYSMLEVITHAQDQTVVEARQFFEAIEDPLLNMLVPMVVQIVIDAIKPTLMGGLCVALPPVLAQIITMPAASGMGAAPAGGGLFGMFGFGFLEESETVENSEKDTGDIAAANGKEKKKESGELKKKTWRSSWEVKNKPRYDSRGEKMRPPRMVATREELSSAKDTGMHVSSLLKDVIKTRYGDKARFARESSTATDAGACAGLATERECVGMRPFPDDGPPLTLKGQPFPHQCSWCTSVAPNAFGVKSQCVSCSQVSIMEAKLGFTCAPDEKACEKRDDDSEPVDFEKMKKLAKRKIVNKLEKNKFEEMTKTEQEIVVQIVGNMIAMLGPVLHLPLSMNMHRDVNASVTRAAGRTLTQTMTMELTKSLVLSLSQSLVRTLSAVSTKEINAYLTPSLTYAITPAVAHSLKHNPKSDFFCFYCSEHQIYCDECRHAQLSMQNDDYYAYYFSRYYAGYYSGYYAGVYADHAARDALADPDVVLKDPKKKRAADEDEIKRARKPTTPSEPRLLKLLGDRSDRSGRVSLIVTVFLGVYYLIIHRYLKVSRHFFINTHRHVN